MQITRRIVLTTAAAAAATPAGAQTMADADILERAFRTLHPGLWRYNTPASLDRLFAVVRADLAAASAPADSWLALTRFTAAIRCGHTFVNPNNQIAAGEAFFAAGRNRLPFTYRWLSGRMIVQAPGPAEALRPGDEVLAIEDDAVPPLLPKLMALAAADGGADAKRRRLAELDKQELWPLADTALPILAPSAFGGHRASLTLARGARRLTAEVPLLTRAERIALRGSADIAPSNGPAWRSEVLADDSRFITMPTWSVYNSEWDWRTWLDAEVDAAIATRAPAIILDLRGNGGGTECGDHLLARMIDREVVRPDIRRKVRYRRTPVELNPYLSTWDRTFRDWGDQAVGPDADGYYRLTKWDTDTRGQVIAPRGPRYSGRLIALVDAVNSSATFQFANTVKANRLGVLVGEPTGGSLRGINGGGYFFLRLPGCGFTVDLPLVATFPAGPQPDAGVAPDVYVPTIASDLRVGRDRQRAAAIRLARTG